jgi:hypothetical protein
LKRSASIRSAETFLDRDRVQFAGVGDAVGGGRKRDVFALIVMPHSVAAGMRANVTLMRSSRERWPPDDAAQKEFEPGATMDRSLIIAVNRLARRHPVNFFESEQY